jgi:aflatoxin B1 aldehyde reductase
MYNAILRNIETELIPACRRYGLDVLVYNPIGGGFFSGKIKLNEIPAEGRFAKDAIMGEWYRDRYFQDANFEALRIIENAAKKYNLTLVETALRWIVHHSKLGIKGGNDGILIGVSSVGQLKSNLKDCEKGPLPEEVVKALDEGWAIAKPTSPDYWHMKLEYKYDTQKELYG